MEASFGFCSVEAVQRGRLSLPDLKHPRAAFRAGALGSGLAVLHGDGLRVFHFPLDPALEAVGFQPGPPSCAARGWGRLRRNVRVSTRLRRFRRFLRHIRSRLPGCQ